MKKKNNLMKLMFVGFLAITNSASAQWTVSGSTWSSPSATKVGVGTTAPFQKFTVEDGNIALTSSAYPSDLGSARWRYITARTNVSILNIGTNPNMTTGEANGPMIQMAATAN